MLSIAAAVLAVAVAATVVLLDLHPPRPRAPRPAVLVPTPPRTVTENSVLGSITATEADQRTAVGRRIGAAVALLAVTVAVAGALAAGIYRLVVGLG